MNWQPYLELSIDLLGEINPNPAAYYPGICRDCGDACDPDEALCYHCQEEQPHEAPETQAV